MCLVVTPRNAYEAISNELQSRICLICVLLPAVEEGTLSPFVCHMYCLVNEWNHPYDEITLASHTIRLHPLNFHMCPGCPPTTISFV